MQYEYKTHNYGRRYASAIGVQRCSSSERVASLDAGLRHGQRHDESCRSSDKQVGASAVVADEGAASLASLLRTTLPDAASRCGLTSVPVRRGSFCPSLTGALFPRSMTWTPPGGRRACPWNPGCFDGWPALTSSTCTNSSWRTTKVGLRIQPSVIGGIPCRLGSCAASKASSVHRPQVIARCTLTAS